MQNTTNCKLTKRMHATASATLTIVLVVVAHAQRSATRPHDNAIIIHSLLYLFSHFFERAKPDSVVDDITHHCLYSKKIGKQNKIIIIYILTKSFNVIADLTVRKWFSETVSDFRWKWSSKLWNDFFLLANKNLRLVVFVFISLSKISNKSIINVFLFNFYCNYFAVVKLKPFIFKKNK